MPATATVAGGSPGARERVETVQNDGGGSGKVLGRVAVPGVDGFVGGDQLLLRGRAPTPASS